MAIAPGCGGSPEPAQPEETGEAGVPPPPTPEEIAKRVARELELDAPLPAAGARLPTSVRATIISQYDEQNAALSKTPEGKAALEIIKQKTDDRIDALYSAGMWEHVLVYTDGYYKLDPKATQYDDMRKKAEVELRRPRVTVQGLPQVNGHQIAILAFYIPLTSETYKEQMRVGEEMHGIKFIEVFGDYKGVRLEYLETGDRFVSLLRRAK
jgi:hypothetical protein